MENGINSLALAAEKGLLEKNWITVIDENGFWLGQALDTISVRRTLQERGFEIRGNYATLQFAQGGK